MHLSKFKKLAFTTLTLLTLQVEAFTTNECLSESFDVNVNHKGFPFGLTEVKLGVSKSGCNIKVTHQKYNYLNSQWNIDICRGPVHIKKGADSVDVLKKIGECNKTSKDEFCAEVKSIFEVISDDGLIFAEGVKENLGSDHGKVYCSFLLMKKYFNDSLIFNATEEYEDNLQTLKGVKMKTQPKKEASVFDSAPRPIVDGASAPVIDEEKQEETEEETKASSSGVGSF